MDGVTRGLLYPSVGTIYQIRCPGDMVPLVQFQQRSFGMWYTLPYANTFLCTPAHGERAGHLGGWALVLVRLYRTPLPDPPRQRRPAAHAHDGTLPGLYRPNRTQHSTCVPPARSHRAAA